MKTYLCYDPADGRVISQTIVAQDHITPPNSPGFQWMEIPESLMGRFWEIWHVVDGVLVMGPAP
jgi:hypothetical protein